MGRKPVLQPLQPPPPSPSPQQSPPTPAPASLPSPSPSPLPSPLRRQPLILREKGVVRTRGKPRCAEVAGGTAAGCLAVCCCCPCGLLSLLVLTVVRLPAGLCRKAIRRRRMKQQMAKKKGVIRSNKALLGEEDEGVGGGVDAAVWMERTHSEEMKEMERMMWEQFQGTGFWRSPSQRDRR